MSPVLFDTNILVDHFNKHSQATNELTAYKDAIISSLSWIDEVSHRILVTRNPKDFGGEGPMVRVPYQISNGQIVSIKPPPP